MKFLLHKSVKFLKAYSLPLLPSRYTYEIKLLEYPHVNSGNTHHADLGEIGRSQTISCRKLLEILCFVDRASLYYLVNRTNLVHTFS
jgi:hypothetical protein